MPRHTRIDFPLAGHTYTILATGRTIREVACAGRWPLTPIEYIGLDRWTLDQLQAKLNSVIEEEDHDTTH